MYLGFLHSTQHGKPSLVCDVQELYRHCIDDFLIQYGQDLRKKDFVVKTESRSRTKQGQRAYLNDASTSDLVKNIHEFFESKVEHPRTRVGTQQTITTLINEEAALYAKFLRGELRTWNPRVSKTI
jgi:CRISPR/Cas system-associated endonuclease Cas1